jgi:hypothetical protein
VALISSKELSPLNAAHTSMSGTPMLAGGRSGLGGFQTRESESDTRDIAAYLLTAAQPLGGAASSAQQPTAATFFEGRASLLVFPLR